jgi:hypothetical protein
MAKKNFLTFVFCITKHHNFMHKGLAFFLCHCSPNLLDCIAKPLPITNYSASLLPQFRRRRFFIFVLQFGEQQIPSKYVLGVASSVPVLLAPTKYHLAWCLFIPPISSSQFVSSWSIFNLFSLSQVAVFPENSPYRHYVCCPPTPPQWLPHNIPMRYENYQLMCTNCRRCQTVLETTQQVSLAVTI